MKAGAEEVMKNCVRSKEETVTIVTQMPFSVAVKLSNLKFQQIQKVTIDEPFCLMTYIKSNSPHSITIQDTKFEIKTDFRFRDAINSQVAGIEMLEGDSVS